MMTIFRVILRDLRRVALLLIAGGVIVLLALHAAHAAWIDPEFVVWLERLLMLAIGAEVVFGDPVDGGQAQWRTRPISGGAMAVGKTLMLGGVAFGVGVGAFASGIAVGSEVWPGMTLGLWEVFRAALWVMLGAALAVLVDSPRRFVAQTGIALGTAVLVVVAVLFLARHSEWMTTLVVRGAREHGTAVMLAGGLSMVFAFTAVARRYMWPYYIWAARGLAWLACLFVLGHEGLRLLVR